jgi:hypothetical protein
VASAYIESVAPISNLWYTGTDTVGSKHMFFMESHFGYRGTSFIDRVAASLPSQHSSEQARSDSIVLTDLQHATIESLM